MNQLNKIAVFCGASLGNHRIYADVAVQLAESLVHRGITLIYGGAGVGIMGSLADQVLKLGGHVVGVMPEDLVRKELAHPNLTELHVVPTMHARKALLAELSDGYLMLPGGSGSLDEFFDILTAAQLGYHKKPCGILNVKNYYDSLISFLDHAVMEGFINQAHKNMIIVASCPKQIIDRFAHYQAPSEVRWVKEQVQ